MIYKLKINVKFDNAMDQDVGYRRIGLKLSLGVI
jgi:hypothetical protein